MERDLGFVHLLIDSDHLVITYKAERVPITAVTAEYISRERLLFQRGVSYPAIVRFEGIPASSREDRLLFMSENINGIDALAIVADNSLKSVFATFLIRVDRPPIPCREFDDEKKARQWLRRTIFKKNPFRHEYSIDIVPAL